MKRIIIGFVIFISALSLCAARQDTSRKTNGELLTLLDSELAKRDDYVAQRRHAIDSVSSLIPADSLHAADRYIEVGVLPGRH